ncbi:hypothetical protein TVAG_164530 [Trichomonas vaginalis G3]|uniref:Uncharacterized protein n=1 Tax=Trichomonas vaginalis (strain ATCC PRA-98 / G3) TaxID=412133 RepID=A2E1Z4_TRIV3|nr:nucleotide-diphospho-sugar transferases family [Trichomonas vaginalis G3]EAY13343.1 hypothetical protein TVAG_164530 [Trichomonas vaginalis G3]KAI5540388.1 nucleotide-diphospho-sugar transferases family [Trichomonas vaginalis G3]|eukprot:XP_001325566.1 hypothetical protein [Trichomonas vaginalis G3]
MSILNQTISDPFVAECLDNRYSRRMNYTSFCVDRDDPSRLSCILNIAPPIAKKKHVLVVGSTTPIGYSLVSELKELNIPYVEIKGKSHIDLNQMASYDVLRSVDYRLAFLCLEQLEDPAFLLAFIRRIKVPTYTFSKDLAIPETILVDSPKIVGPQYLSFHNDLLNVIVSRCALTENPSVNEPNEYLVGSKSAAKYITEKLYPYIIGETDDYPRAIMIPARTDTEKLFETIAYKYPKCDLTLNGKRVLGKLDPEVEDGVDFAAKQLIPTEEIYLSIVFVTNELDFTTDNMNKQLAWLDNYVKRYPATPIEVIIVLLTHSRGVGVIFPGKYIKPHVKVIIVPFDQSKSEETNPEYLMRNVGIRRASGEFIICANTDVLIPISLLDAARRKEFSNIALIRSEMKPIYLSYEQAMAKFLSEGATQQIYSWFNPWKEIGSNKETHGVLQGCHRKVWEAVGGYAEGPWCSDVDTAFVVEFPVITEKTFIQRFFGAFKYVDQKKLVGGGFPNVKKITEQSVCKGVSPKKLIGVATKNWGDVNKKLKIETYV